MVQSLHWSTKTLRFFLRVSSCAPGVLFILVLARYAEGSNFYSKQYGLPCSQCHDKIPTLKEFGQSFKTNGYSFEKKVSDPKKTSGSGGSKLPVAPPQSPSSSSDDTNKKNKDDAAQKTAVTPTFDTTEYIYRGQSDAGTYIFSDNPSRVSGEVNEDSLQASGRSPRKKNSRTVKAGKSAVQKKAHTRPRKKNSDSGTAAMTEKPRGPEPVVAPLPVSPGAVLPRNYEECMEKILVNVDQPKNGTDVMELFEKAAQSCAPYAVQQK